MLPQNTDRSCLAGKILLVAIRCPSSYAPAIWLHYSHLSTLSARWRTAHKYLGLQSSHWIIFSAHKEKEQSYYTMTYFSTWIARIEVSITGYLARLWSPWPSLRRRDAPWVSCATYVRKKKWRNNRSKSTEHLRSSSGILIDVEIADQVLNDRSAHCIQVDRRPSFKFQGSGQDCIITLGLQRWNRKGHKNEAPSKMIRLNKSLW